MPAGAALSEGSSGENISHFSSIRIRLTGIGRLKMTVYSLDHIRNKALVSFTMAATARIMPTRLVNFMEQRASFELMTTDLDDYFRINRIIIFSKEVYKSYPGS